MIPKEDLDKIYKYGLGEVNNDKLYTFSIMLCDNEIDRDGEQFSLTALNQLAELHVGKVGLFTDLDLITNSNYLARIYNTEVRPVEGKFNSVGEPLYQVIAKAYIVRCPETERIILEIESGIKKEASIGCRMKSKICSVCGNNVLENKCVHTKEDDSYLILNDIEDVYEWSFTVFSRNNKSNDINEHSYTFDDYESSKSHQYCSGLNIYNLLDELRLLIDCGETNTDVLLSAVDGIEGEVRGLERKLNSSDDVEYVLYYVDADDMTEMKYEIGVFSDENHANYVCFMMNEKSKMRCIYMVEERGV